MFSSNAWQGGFQALQAFGSYIAANKKAAADRKWQAYNNKMTRLQDAQNQNAITTNELMRKERKQEQLINIQKQERETLASAEVSAAASGTIGRSVNMVLFDINRNAAAARGAVERDDQYQDVVTDNQRMQSAMQTELQMDLRQITGGSASSLMLGLGSALVTATKK